MKKCIVTGMAPIYTEQWSPYLETIIKTETGFYLFNGDIEVDEQGREIYVTEKQIEGSTESEDVYVLVEDMPKELQDYIAKNRKWVESAK